LLVAPDDPDALAEGIYSLWSTPVWRTTLADRAFHGVRAHYTVSQSAARLLEVYASVLGDAKALGLSVA
jgi:glycosyltransferase involved in cell wall biosynthesis